jgi:hypothetical protein
MKSLLKENLNLHWWIDSNPTEFYLAWKGWDKWWKTKKKIFCFVGSSTLSIDSSIVYHDKNYK